MTPRRLEIPFDRDGSGRFLPALIALMVYFAALATSGALALDQALQHWSSGLAGTLTVELPAADDKAKDQFPAALAALKATPGIVSATPLERVQIAKLLEPWLGPGVAADELALPRLIDVRIDPGFDLAALRGALFRAAPSAVLDDHRIWLDRLAALGFTAEATALLILALVIAAAAMVVIFATRTGLSVHRDVIDLLHLMGARDGYIAAQFQQRALRLGLSGGLIGLGLALATLLALAHAGDAATSLGAYATPVPSLRLALRHWAILFLLPPAASLIAMLTARFTVLGALTRMP